MKMYSLMSVRIGLVVGFLSFVIVPRTSSVSFNLMNFSNCNTVDEYINFQADAFCESNNSAISLTAPVPVQVQKSIGRATYNQPVPLWDEKSGGVINFTCKFSFMITNVSKTQSLADGFTFFLAPYPSEIPENAYDYYAGGYFALFEKPTNAIYPSNNKIVAVEFDTWNNEFDPPGIDCHVGIDINTLASTNPFINASTCFIVGSPMTAQIEYNSGLKLLSVLLWRDADPRINYSLSATVDISKVLPNKGAVGFSAVTDRSYLELFHIFSWSFESTLEVKQPSRTALTIGGIGAGVLIILILTGFLIYCLIKRKRIIRNTKETELIDFEFEKGKGPKKFTYRELVDATNGFAENKKLGEGGFGSVYRGILLNENIHVAVKRVSKESKQGKKEYISEVKIISQLRHRNLVQLVGWCHDQGELLLVYELVHNGSLDTHLYSTESLLIWPIRQNIMLGLGHALFYLHEECEQCVVHRDIKPSNIMLDSSFNAKLGDFGLARLTDHHQDLQTTIVAGTKGYMAPEYFDGIANASTQSDVFSFGVVLRVI